MRFKKEEFVLYSPHQPDLFSPGKEAVFLRYLGGNLARVYIKNEGYFTVPVSRLHHKGKVAA